MESFQLKNQVRLSLSQALLLLYRYLTGIYSLGDLSFSQFLSGFVCGREKDWKENPRLLTLSGNGIGELEKALCLQWNRANLETMSVIPRQMHIFRFLTEATPGEVADFFQWAREGLRAHPNLQALLAFPGLTAYWQQQCAFWQSPEMTGRVRLYSGSPWNLPPAARYDAILLSHAQRILFDHEAKELCALLKPGGILAAVMPIPFCPPPFRPSPLGRFSDFQTVRAIKEEVMAEARRRGYEIPSDEGKEVRWTLSPGDRVQVVSFSLACPLRSLLIGELLIRTLSAEMPEATRLALLESSLQHVPPGAGAGTETLVIFLSERRDS